MFNTDSNFYYLLRKGQPFKGYACSSGSLDEKGVMHVHYTGMTKEQYEKEHGVELEIKTESEFEKLFEEFKNSMKTTPEEVTEERYDYSLNVLPPCRFDGNRFHVSERITDNLVDWFFKKNGKFYHFVDEASIDTAKLCAIIESV